MPGCGCSRNRTSSEEGIEKVVGRRFNRTGIIILNYAFLYQEIINSIAGASPPIAANMDAAQ